MHVHATIYHALCIGCTLLLPNDFLTTVLLMVLAVIHQYFYYLLFLTPVYQEPSCHCAYCEEMTPAAFVHCMRCHGCFPVTYYHSSMIGRCVMPHHMKRYLGVVKIFASTNVLCSAIEAIAYPPMLIAAVFHLAVLKSIYVAAKVDIKG